MSSPGKGSRSLLHWPDRQRNPPHPCSPRIHFSIQDGPTCVSCSLGYARVRLGHMQWPKGALCPAGMVLVWDLAVFFFHIGDVEFHIEEASISEIPHRGAEILGSMCNSTFRIWDFNFWYADFFGGPSTFHEETHPKCVFLKGKLHLWIVISQKFQLRGAITPENPDKRVVYNFAPKARKKSGCKIPHTGKYQ